VKIFDYADPQGRSIPFITFIFLRKTGTNRRLEQIAEEELLDL